MSKTKRALVIAQKQIASAPRILKEISWLSDDGWVVDSLGLGKNSPANGKHIEIRSANAAVRYFSYFIRIKRLRFWLLYERFLPKDFAWLLSRYDLVIIHEPTLFPSKSIRDFIESRGGFGIHVDLHEDHINSLSRNGLEKFAFEAYRKWEMDHLTASVSKAHGNITVSSVTQEISGFFENHLKVRVFTLGNSPSRVSITPSKVESDYFKLVHHGVGTAHRGIEQSIQALRKLPESFELNLYLVSSSLYLLKIRLLSILLGVNRRVVFHKPVPTFQIPTEICKYDVALVVIPPITNNELYAVPNKFLESIQARLAIVTGPNPSMAEIVLENALGIVLDGWRAKDIYLGLINLDKQAIEAMKVNSGKVSVKLSSDQDRGTFLKFVAKSQV